METMTSVEFGLMQTARFGYKHWKSRPFISKINEHISGLRLLAFRKRGTFAGIWCSREATRIEKELERLQR